MTAIAGIVQRDGVVLLGADSLYVTDTGVATVAMPSKVFTLPVAPVADLVVGVSGSPRIGQLLGFRFFAPQAKPSQSALDYAVTFAEAVRDHVIKHGATTVKDGLHDMESRILLGHAGHLFVIASDFVVIEPAENYAAIGSGERCLLAALHVQMASYDEYAASPPYRDLLTRALEAAAHFETGVRGLFHFASSSPPPP